jgi:hypothetical protein
MSENVASRAWDAVKDKSDPSYDGITNGSFKEELEARVDGVRRTGVTVNPFEEEVKKLIDAEKSDSAMGTSVVKGAASAPAESSDLSTMKRAELDAEAEKAGLNPDDYATKADVIEAIEKARK